MREFFADFVAPVGFLAAVLLGAVFFGSQLAGALSPEPVVSEPAPPPCGDYWVVTPGDTLWDIARRCYPGRHTGQMVATIREANPGVDPGRLRVGQTLRLPVATDIAGGAE